MSRCKDGRIGCNQCGTIRAFAEWLSWRGLCPDCGETNLVENLWGLVTPGSVPWKRHKVAVQVAHMGAHKVTTPSPEMISFLRTRGY